MSGTTEQNTPLVLEYDSTDDYRATGDGLTDWYAGADGTTYGLTDDEQVLDADGMQLTSESEARRVRAAIGECVRRQGRWLARLLYAQSHGAGNNPQDLSGEEAHEHWTATAGTHGDWVTGNTLRRVHRPSFEAAWNTLAMDGRRRAFEARS
jgi:hypothetical protein